MKRKSCFYVKRKALIPRILGIFLYLLITPPHYAYFLLTVIFFQKSCYPWSWSELCEHPKEPKALWTMLLLCGPFHLIQSVPHTPASIPVRPIWSPLNPHPTPHTELSLNRGHYWLHHCKTIQGLKLHVDAILMPLLTYVISYENLPFK